MIGSFFCSAHFINANQFVPCPPSPPTPLSLCYSIACGGGTNQIPITKTNRTTILSYNNHRLVGWFGFCAIPHINIDISIYAHMRTSIFMILKKSNNGIKIHPMRRKVFSQPFACRWWWCGFFFFSWSYYGKLQIFHLKHIAEYTKQNIHKRRPKKQPITATMIWNTLIFTRCNLVECQTRAKVEITFNMCSYLWKSFSFTKEEKMISNSFSCESLFWPFESTCVFVLQTILHNRRTSKIITQYTDH